jgi:hypothetical protein
VLVGIDEHAVKSFTPMSKCIEVTLEKENCSSLRKQLGQLSPDFVDLDAQDFGVVPAVGQGG